MLKIAFAGIFLLNTGMSFSQKPEDIASPNVMSFGIFDTYPAANSTGVPDITVPIYTMEYHGIKVPISLRYNTNLVKPDLHPGWVGLGWNLNVGGIITRIVKDKPDDSNFTNP